MTIHDFGGFVAVFVLIFTGAFVNVSASPLERSNNGHLRPVFTEHNQTPGSRRYADWAAEIEQGENYTSVRTGAIFSTWATPGKAVDEADRKAVGLVREPGSFALLGLGLLTLLLLGRVRRRR
ncbi:hypothetical protein [Marinobacter sp. F4206]|uniref:hypothetical protein n=1 Tax=Marinobacter sp. F4206 TaxID=2861777 RepID=UPI001C5DBCB5|nr:hypothetical protein [Marinobacter sp. F4206]MBW4933421.1 hypothetical protein [Marinobacter sp. F4206]